MKFDTQLTIGGVEARLIEYDVHLGLSEIGRANFIIQSDERPLPGVAVFDCGYAGAGFYRYFIGSVRKIVKREGDSWAIHCRELAMALEINCPISLRNCTMLDVVRDIERRTTLVFSGTADLGAYATTKVPRFAHSGSALHAVQAFADVFNISDFVWYQRKDGNLWCGSYADTVNAKRDDVSIPDRFFTRQLAANMATLPAVPAIRPGTRINEKRITSTRLHDHKVQIQWNG